MHGLLYFTMRDYKIEDDGSLSQWDLSTYTELCERNFYQGLETYESLVIPTLENIQSLFIAVSNALAPSWPDTNLSQGHNSTRKVQEPTRVDLCRRRAFHVPDIGLSPRVESEKGFG